MNQSSTLRLPVLLAALAVCSAAPAAWAQSADAQASEATSRDGMASDTASDEATIKADEARQRALRSDTSSNTIKTLEDKQAKDKAREKGQPVEEEEESP